MRINRISTINNCQLIAMLLVPVVVLVFGASASTAIPSQSYPSVCLHSRDLVYYNSSMVMFAEAKHMCEYHGGHLLFFDSPNQYIYIIDFLTNLQSTPAELAAGLYIGYNRHTNTYTNGLEFIPTYVADTVKMANCDACVVINMANAFWNCEPCEEKVALH